MFTTINTEQIQKSFTLEFRSDTMFVSDNIESLGLYLRDIDDDKLFCTVMSNVMCNM